MIQPHSFPDFQHNEDIGFTVAVFRKMKVGWHIGYDTMIDTMVDTMILNISQPFHCRYCIQTWTNHKILVFRKQSDKFLQHSTGVWLLDQIRCMFRSIASAVTTWPNMKRACSMEMHPAQKLRNTPSFLGIGIAVLPCVI